MDYEKAKEIVESAAETAGAFGKLRNDLYDKKDGMVPSINTALEKIGNVDANYAMQLAMNLRRQIKKIPALCEAYEALRKLLPKKLRKALKITINKEVMEPADLARDAYNSKVKSKQFQMEASAVINNYQNVRYGI